MVCFRLMTTASDTVLIRYWPDEEDLFHDHVREAVFHFDALAPDGESSGTLTVTVLMNEDHAGTILTEPLAFGPDLRHYAIPIWLPEGGADPVFRLTQTTGPVEVMNREVVTPAATVAYTDPDNYRVTATA